MLERIKGFGHYAKHAVQRWFSPRAYVISYTYEKDDGSLVHESKIIRTYTLEVDLLMNYITSRAGSYTIHIDSITEFPGSYEDLPIIDLAKYVEAQALKVAKEIKEENSPALSLEGSEKNTDNQSDISQETESDLDNFLNNR